MDLTATDSLNIAYAVLVGLSFGTFFNVVADRLPQGMSLVFPASHCPTCKHPIAVRDNIPVFSFIWLRGKCRYCAAPIPKRVPIVEAGTAVLFAIAVARFDVSVEAAVVLVSVGIFLVIAIIDYDTRLIPNVLVGPGLVVALALFPFGPGSEWEVGEAYIRTFAGAASGFGLLLSVYLVAQFMGSAMGAGDVKLAALIGAATGFPDMFGALLLGFVGGGVISIYLMVVHKRSRKEAIPFGPFLAGGAIVTLLTEAAIGDWYLGLYS